MALYILSFVGVLLARYSLEQERDIYYFHHLGAKFQNSYLTSI
jgi:hypothetical protein